jgi:hypothetical protein
MVVLDRSMSMATRPDATTITDVSEEGESRWAVVSSAVDDMIANSPAFVNWGLVLFPRFYPPDQADGLGCAVLPDAITNGYTPTNDPSVCSLGELTDSPSPDATAVLADVTEEGTYLCDQTATAVGLREAKTVSPDYVILVTDGEYECSDDPAPVVAELAAQGARTFVVGIDGSTTALGVKGRASLNTCACLGGVPENPSACNGTAYDPSSGENSFYFANDPNGNTLAPILAGISAKVACN